MSSPLSFMHIDRHSVWGARPASVCILLGFLGLIGAGIIFEPSRAEPQAEINPRAISGRFALSACIPHDGALGNESGDPYAFYIFNREEYLASMRANSCPSVVARMPEPEPAAQDGVLYEVVAQSYLPQQTPASP